MKQQHSARRRLGRLAATTLAVAFVASGCAAGPDASGNGSEIHHLTIAIPNTAPPFTASNQAAATLRVTSNVFDPLLFWDPETQKFSPGLATEWNQVSDTEVDLTIRDGVKFHDGTPMTADDVAFTLSEERLWGAEALEPTSLADTFAGADVIDENTVRVTTKHPDPALLSRLSTSIGFVVPHALIESEGIEAFGLHPVGTGPYQVEKVAPGERVDLVANESYWGPEASYSSVTFVEVPEVSARVSGLATGEYNIATDLPPDQTSLIESNGQQVSSTAVNNVVMLGFMTAKEDSPVSDPLVRHAMELTVNRNEIASSLWSDLVEVPDGFNLPLYTDFYEPNDAVEQDVEHAKELLEKSDYNGEPITIRWINGYYTNLDRALDVMQGEWAEIGLNINLEGVADFSLLDIPSSDVYATSNNVAFDDPISPLWTDWISPSSRYISEGRGTVSPELTEAGSTLIGNLDLETRQQAYRDVIRLWRDELPGLTVWQPVDIYGLSDGIELTPDPRYWMRLAAVPAN